MTRSLCGSLRVGLIRVGLMVWYGLACGALSINATEQSTTQRPGAAKPNIIVFLVDDMGWMDCGAYGSKYYETPHIDRFAKQSMRFTDAYSQPLCSPTRASLLTGQYSARHGITSASGHLAPQPVGHAFLPATAPANRPLRMPESKNYLEPSQFTLAEALREQGYRTAHLGKWHLGTTPPHWPEQQGFDVAFHCHPDPGPPGNYFSPYGVVPQGETKGKQRLGTITDGPDGEYITDRLTDEAIRFVKSHRDQPFFLNLWHYGVHGPWGHKAAYTAEFAKKTDPRGLQGNPIMASMLKSIDESLGRILATLDELRLAGNTIVVFTSDNGGNVHSNTEEDGKSKKRKNDDSALNEWRKWAGNRPPTNNTPLRDGKGRLYEGGIRVPLMVRWPEKIAAGSTSAAVVGAIDLYPTLLDLVGVPLPSQQIIDGRSYGPVLRQTGALEREAYFIWFPHLVPGVVVRQGDWKLIRRYETRAEYDGLHELFNLRDDLGESTNLAKKMPEKVRELDRLIDRFLTETRAVTPQPNPAFKATASGTTTTTTSPTTTAPKGATAVAEVTNGLVPRAMNMRSVAAGLEITPDGPLPFWGIAGLRHDGPLVLTMRVRTGEAGRAKVLWRTTEQAEFPATGQSVEYRLEPSDTMTDITVKLPLEGRPAVVRLHFPTTKTPLQIESLRFTTERGDRVVKAWNFKP